MNAAATFVICVDNSDYPASLELCKVYRRLENEGPEDTGFIRLIDESGEDYYYPASMFEPIAVPDRVESILAAV